MVKSSDSIEPRRPKRAPEAPTEILFLINREDSMLPPSPANRYITPILTANCPEISDFYDTTNVITELVHSFTNLTETKLLLKADTDEDEA